MALINILHTRLVDESTKCVTNQKTVSFCGIPLTKNTWSTKLKYEVEECLWGTDKKIGFKNG